MIDLTGKVALITGAGSGLGAVEAALFAELGALVIAADIDDEALAGTASTLPSNAMTVHLDVSDEASWSRAISAIESRHSRLDVLVNNAGIFRASRLEFTESEEYDLLVSINQRSVYLGMRSVIALMRAAGGGSIVNISSGAATHAVPGAFAYSASKWAVRGMSLAAAVELAADHIRVNVLYPGSIETPMHAQNPVEMKEYQLTTIPLGRFGTSGEVAALVAFLASPMSSYVTGAEIRIDGGRHA